MDDLHFDVTQRREIAIALEEYKKDFEVSLESLASQITDSLPRDAGLSVSASALKGVLGISPRKRGSRPRSYRAIYEFLRLKNRIENFRPMNRYLDQRGLSQQFAIFMDSFPLNLDVAGRLEGCYQFYQRSERFPGEVVKSKVTIGYNRISGALDVVETQRTTFESDGVSLSMEEEFTGYAIPKQNPEIILLILRQEKIMTPKICIFDDVQNTAEQSSVKFASGKMIKPGDGNVFDSGVLMIRKDEQKILTEVTGIDKVGSFIKSVIEFGKVKKENG